MLFPSSSTHSRAKSTLARSFHAIRVPLLDAPDAGNEVLAGNLVHSKADLARECLGASGRVAGQDCLSFGHLGEEDKPQKRDCPATVSN